MKDRWAGHPFELAPFQRDHMIRPVYGQLNRQGRRKIKRALFGLPRWHGKSEIAAALHLYHLFAEPVYGGEQYAFATTRAQAAIVLDTAKRMAQADPLLRAGARFYRQVIEVPETGAVFRALPFDADTSQGFHPTFATGDEVHVMKNLDMVDAMVSGMVGRTEGLFVAISTEGPRPDNTLRLLRDQWASDAEAYVYWAGARKGQDLHDPRVWRQSNPAPWITDAMLASQYRGLPWATFCRLHLNYLPPELAGSRAFNPKAWEACSAAPVFDPLLPCVVGVDAAPRRDKTAVVLDQRNPETGVHQVRLFTFEADPEAGLLDFDELKECLRGLCRKHRVDRIVVDPAHLFSTMDELGREGLPIEDFPQHASRMIPASTNLYDLVQLGRVAHGGEPVLTRHVLAAGVKEIPPSGWRITRVSRSEFIDGAVALAMAAWVAEAEWANRTPSFAESGGVWTIDL